MHWRVCLRARAWEAQSLAAEPGFSQLQPQLHRDPRYCVPPVCQRRRQCKCSVTALALGGGPAGTQLLVMERRVSESPGETCLFSKSGL